MIWTSEKTQFISRQHQETYPFSKPSGHAVAPNLLPTQQVPGSPSPGVKWSSPHLVRRLRINVSILQLPQYAFTEYTDILI